MFCSIKRTIIILVVLLSFFAYLWDFAASSTLPPVDFEKILSSLKQPSPDVKLGSKAVLSFLKAYEKTQDPKYLNYAKNLLEILVPLQKEDGSFEPADRLTELEALFAISRGARVFKGSDAVFSQKLSGASEKAINYVLKEKDILKEKGRYKIRFEYKIPAWLIKDSPRLSAIFALGLMEYYEASARNDIYALIESLGDGISQCSLGNFDVYPFYAHFLDSENINYWSLKDNYIVTFLARAGKRFLKPAWVRSAEREAGSLYTHLIASACILDYYPYPCVFSNDVDELSRMIGNSMEIYRATDKEPYFVIAGLAGSMVPARIEGLENQLALFDIFLDIDGTRASDYFGFKSAADFSFKTIDAASGIWARKEYEVMPYSQLFKEYEPEPLTAGSSSPESQNAESLASRSGPSSQPAGISPLPPAEQDPGTIEGAPSLPPAKQIYNMPKMSGLYLKFLEKQDSELLKRNVVILDRETVYWHKLSIPEDSFYLLYLVFLKQPGFSMNISSGVRVDGHTVYTIPMASEKYEESFMAMEKIADPFHLSEGFHTVGVKYNGLQFSYRGYVDSLIVQPVVERKLFRDSEGCNLLFLKSFAPADFFYGLPLKDVKGENINIKVYSYTGYLKEEKKIKTSDFTDKIGVKILGYGYTVVKW